MFADEEETDEESSEEDSEDDPDADPDAIKVNSESSEEEVERYDDEKADAKTQEEKAEESSSGDEDSETCAICLGKLTSTKLPSKPDSGCPHLFCRECLVEWSKQVHIRVFINSQNILPIQIYLVLRFIDKFS